MRFPLFAVLLFVACGPQTDFPSLKPFSGEWKAKVTVTPITFNTTQQPPPPMTYETTIFATPADYTVTLAGICPSSQDTVELAASQERPYWIGQVAGCAVIAERECATVVFDLTSIEAKLDGDDVMHGEGGGESIMHGEGGGQASACGTTWPSLVKFTANKTPAVASSNSLP